MRKNDKLIVIIGVVILLISSIGIFLWVPDTTGAQGAEIEDVYGVCGTLCDVPNSITVSDDCPFYALVATPLAVHYDAEDNQEIIPLYVKNFDNPSRAIERVKYDQLKTLGRDECIIDGSESVKNVSLKIAQDHWESSDAALIIEDNESGYNLGVIATPLASYLRIPVIVTDKIDQDVMNVLSHLGVKYTIVCGENIEGFGNVLRFGNVEEIVDAQIDLLMDKFGDINYLTLTNPADAFPPKVLDSVEKHFGSSSEEWSFTIPNGYKYALVKIEANTDEPVSFTIGADLEDIHPELQENEITDGGPAIPKRDAKGNILGYKFYRESVVYDRGGVTYNIYGSTDVSAYVTIEKLEDPVHPMMKGLSTLAPYLTACHQGLIFGKPDFAFTANDDLRNEDGEKLSGFYMPRFNSELTTISNKHIYDNIHKPLNDVLAKIADVSPLQEKTYTKDVKALRNYFDKKDFSIALVGGATVLPQYIYQNLLEPFGDVDGDGTDDTAYGMGGGGTPSDVIYGNIDPVKYDWSNKAQDIYSDLPHMENVVGRIAGWDAQDASALILRSIFYDEIIENLEEWKDNFGILIGDGVDHQKPWLRFKLEQHLKVFTIIKNIASNIPATAGLVHFMDSNGPWKHETGATDISGLRIKDKIAEAMGFEANYALKSHAMIDGYSEDELDQIKDKNIISRLFMRKGDLRALIGDQVVKGGEYMENSNYIFANGHGAISTFGMDGPDLVAAGYGKIIEKIILRFTPIGGGWLGPGFGLGKSYTPISVTGLDMGPSFMFLDSCTCGKIDGVYPEQNVVLALLHAGVGNIISSTTGSNIPGGYLPGKNKMTDTPLSVWKAYREWERKAEQGIYPDLHFGFKLFEDISNYAKEKDCSIGEAFKHAKNTYLPEDITWELWWTPPLSSSSDTPDVYGRHDEAKYTTYFEFVLYGDPAFNPYEPINE